MQSLSWLNNICRCESSRQGIILSPLFVSISGCSEIQPHRTYTSGVDVHVTSLFTSAELMETPYILHLSAFQTV